MHTNERFTRVVVQQSSLGLTLAIDVASSCSLTVFKSRLKTTSSVRHLTSATSSVRQRHWSLSFSTYWRFTSQIIIIITYDCVCVCLQCMEWDAFCWLCHEVGGGISNCCCCEICPRLYHRKCLGFKAAAVGYWICPECEVCALPERWQGGQVNFFPFSRLRKVLQKPNWVL